MREETPLTLPAIAPAPSYVWPLQFSTPFILKFLEYGMDQGFPICHYRIEQNQETLP